MVGRPAVALDEAAVGASDGRFALEVVHAERREADRLDAVLLLVARGAEDVRVTLNCRDGTAGLACHDSRLKRYLLARDHANNEILKLAMIETKESLENLDEIMSTPGVDGIYIGPADLSLAIGEKPGFDKPESTKAYSEILRILEHAKKNKIIAGIQNGQPEYAEKMIKKGFQLVTIGSDQRYMTAASKSALSKLKKEYSTDKIDKVKGLIYDYLNSKKVEFFNFNILQKKLDKNLIKPEIIFTKSKISFATSFICKIKCPVKRSIFIFW